MSIKLFLICVWSVGVFSVRAAVPVEGIIYFKEGKSVGFSGDHRVCIPKKGKDVKAFRGIFTRDKQKEVYPAEEIDSIVCWHPRTPEFRRKFILAEGIGWCWQYFATPHIEAYVYSGRGYGIASNGGIQVWQRRGVFSRSRVIYYLRERLCRYVADDAELCRRIRSLDTWRDKTVLMLQEYHIGH